MQLMMKFRIHNFGPIIKGFTQDEYMNISGVTIFIGGQGTGKSTLAKVLSTLMWIEKALVRDDFSEKALQQTGKFKTHFAFNGIHGYFQKETEIEYCGEYYHLHYQAEKLGIEKMDFGSEILLPKIMYVPSERNFVSVIPKPSVISNLSLSIATFLDEYENAKRTLSGPISLPVTDGEFSYDKLNDISWVERKGNKTRLSQASSGYQSVIPLYLVTRYLSELISNEDVPLNVTNYRNMRKELELIMNNEKMDSTKKNYFLNMILPKYKPSYLVNIVEEPEQNLFPDSQIRMFHALLEYQNKQKHNQLIVTTHSPYIVNALSLSVACFMAAKTVSGHEKHLEKLRAIVPSPAWLDPEMYTVYQLDEEGNIAKLPTFDSIPSDENILNSCLGDFNDSFSRIMEIEDSL